ncbi:MAG: hypothetical protein Ct9H90mP25_2790 [Gammaproteobacteria bacterium]|nr:MAG: hypothetical protein Ct9H90mP25_2790 [Gammaproteobacteria bacterium]
MPDWFSKESIVVVDGLVLSPCNLYRGFFWPEPFITPNYTLLYTRGYFVSWMPGIIWIISTISVVVGAGVVYSFPPFGGYDKYFEKNHPKAVVT